MTFLQPLLLAALPLIALPIIIHLINRQRHRTVQWAAMMFLLDAKRMTRGMARLRYWLIMLMRMLAIAGLIFAVSRPLASGWLGMAAGGGADTTIILLDRSASTEQQELQTARSKRSVAVEKLSDFFQTLGGAGQLVLIENTENVAMVIDETNQLSELPQTRPTSTACDLPAMLQTALDYIVANNSGRTDIWICSDMRAADWKRDDGRWASLRNEFQQLDGTRFYLLSYPEQADDNLAITVTDARLRSSENAATLSLDIKVTRTGQDQSLQQIPLEFVINDARSVLTIEMTENEYLLQGHTIELNDAGDAGWGRVELPADANPRDNVSCFVFSTLPTHRSMIVAEDNDIAETIRVALTAPANPDARYEAEIVTPDRVGEIDWSQSSMIIWQAPIPDASVVSQLEAFAKSGRPVIFFPPSQPTDNSAFGLSWGSWKSNDAEQPIPIASWRGDSGLLQQTLSGEPLPVGELNVYRYLELEGEANSLAQLDGGSRLLAQATQVDGPVYFCTTLPRSSHSTLAQDGVTFYVMLQRALTTGAATQGAARQDVAGSESARNLEGWQSLFLIDPDVLSSQQWTQTGVFQKDDRLLALNRPATEDVPTTLGKDQIADLFGDIEYRQVEEQLSDRSALASEIWRAFLLAMAFALILEALLCVPEAKPSQSELVQGRKAKEFQSESVTV